MIRRVAVYSVKGCGRFSRFSTTANNLTTGEAAPSAVTAPVAPPVPPKAVPVNTNTSTFFQRINAFLFGAGLGFGAGSFMVYEELSTSNKILEDKLASIHDRMDIIDGA
jgi:hypothetical protein